MWTLMVMLSCKKQPVVVESSPAPPAVEAPEQATGCRGEVAPVTSTGGIVVSAHPEATAIGAEVLRDGGTALDAAAAVAVALTLVEPQSSGIGGGAFLLHYDVKNAEITAWDGRETAPRASTPEMFMADERARAFDEVVPGGLSVGVPGLLRMLELAHQEFGSTPFAELLLPTAGLARRGFEVTPRMARSIEQIEGRQDVLRRFPSTKAYFYPDGTALRAGDQLRNPALALTLETLAREGIGAFYGGSVGQNLVAAVNEASVNPGPLTIGDLADYRALKRKPVCLDYRGHQVCGHPPPTSGGVTTLQILGQLERFELGAADSPGFLHLFGDSVALAWADRGRYLGDPAVGVPVDALLDDAYLAKRSALLDPTKLASISPGELVFDTDETALCPEGTDTTHLVVADAAGNVVSLTSSIENAFGSGLFVDGYLLNNQLTDFARDPRGPDGELLPNAPAACKRPRSSMSPLIVLDDQGKVELAVGSPGGAAIIQYTARVTLGVLDQGLSLQEAIERPNVVRNGDTLLIETDCGRPLIPEAVEARLRELGHTVKPGSFNSGLHGIERTENGWRSGIDPRREGAALSVEP